MKVVGFRVDASEKIGTGHFVRCVTLANQLKSEKVKSVFFSRHLSEKLINELKVQGHEFVNINLGCADFDQFSLYENWLECTQEIDATSLLESCDQLFDLFIVDHYALDEYWERRISSITKKILVIDDLANRKHFCNFLLDQSLNINLETRYKGLVNENCELLLGPKFALLKPEFYKIEPSEVKGNLDNILIFYGGADPSGETVKLLEVLIGNYLSNAFWKELNVVIGSLNKQKDYISNMCEQLPNANLLIDTDKMAEILSKSTLSFCAGGTFTWERIKMNVPAIVTCTADNQLGIKNFLNELMIIKVVDIGATLESFTHIIKDIVDNVVNKNEVFLVAKNLKIGSENVLSRIEL